MKPPIDRTRTSSFQGMRIIAILGIVLLHAGKSIGDVGCLVSFFFVLSGFLYHDHNSIKEYYSHCLKKIFPIYWLTFLIDFILHNRSVSNGIIPHLFLLQTYWPMPEVPGGLPYYYEYLGVSWFLSCLLFCYLVAPFISRIICKIQRDHLFLFLALLVFGIAFYLNLEIPDTYQKWAWYTSPYFRCMEYCTGMILSFILTDSKFIVPATNHCSVLLGIVCLLAYYCSYLFIHTNLWVIPNLFIILFIYTFNPAWCSKLLGNRFVSRCASLILPLYLIHQSLIIVIRDYGGGWIYCTILSIILGLIYAYISSLFLAPLTRAKA